MKTSFYPACFVFIASLFFLVLSYFPSFFLDSTFIEYNRLPVDGLPNVDLYTAHSVKTAAKVLYSLVPHNGPPTRDSWNAPGQYHPVYQYQNRAFQKGEWPWWDPYTGLGVPLFAFGHEMLFNPLSLLFYWVNPTWWDMIYLLMMTGFSCSVFQLLRLFEISLLVAVPLAVASPLIGGIPLATGFGGETLAFCLFPFSLLVTEKFVRQPSLWNIAGMGLSIHLLFTTGMPEATLALFTFIWIYYFVRVFELKRPFLSHTALWVGIFLAGALWTSPQWVHLFHNVMQGETREGTGHLYLPVDALLGWPIRYVGGWQGFEVHPDWDKIAQVGHIGIVGTLCLFGAWLFRGKIHQKSCLFWIWPVLYVVKNYGIIPWIAEYSGYIPLYGRMWIFRYFAPTLHICLLMLIGTFLNFLWQQDRRIVNRYGYWAFGITVLIVLSGLLDVSWRADFQITNHGWQLAARWVGLTLVFGLLSAALLRYGKAVSVSIVGLCAILLFECWAGVPRRKYSPRLHPYEEKSYVAFLKKQPGLFRVVSLGNFLFPRNSMAVELSNLKYQLAVYPAHMQHFFELIRKNENFMELDWKGKPELLQPLFSGLNVRYLIQRSPNRPQALDFKTVLPEARWQKVYSDEFAEVFENRDALPRAFFVHQLGWLPEKEMSEYTMETFAGNLLKAYIRAEKMPVWVDDFTTEDHDRHPQMLQIAQETGSRFSIRYLAETSQFVVVSNTFYPGWTALIDGKETRLYQVNLTMQGVFVPAGSHQLVLEYEPLFWPQTRIAAIVGLVLFLGMFFLSKKLKSPRFLFKDC
ncbi:MAG: hypothetical protein HQM14_11065 [SAR324 cluster bacterium]|nr:hypothetical protein [SAR324 cluster bacterium]